MQTTQQLASRIAKLSPDQQAILDKSITKLESVSPGVQMTLDQVIDEFELEHPELLRLLAQ